MYNLGYKVVFIVEGNLKDASFTYESLLGAVVNAELTEGTHVFRTWDIKETHQLIQQLHKKMPLHCHAPTDYLVTSKRKKDNDVKNIWVMQLACIPLISESIARLSLFISARCVICGTPSSQPSFRMSPSERQGVF